MVRRLLLVISLFIAFTARAWAEPEIFMGLVSGAGAGGYDVVSYFSGTPKEGKEEFTVQWKDARWRFASAENLKMFEAAPEKYAPQYGGYCAFAVAQGATAEGHLDRGRWQALPEFFTRRAGGMALGHSGLCCRHQCQLAEGAGIGAPLWQPVIS